MPSGGGAVEARLIAQRLARVPDELRKSMRPALRSAVQPIVADAKARASWSSRIPKSITSSVSFSQSKPGVTIRASARVAPHARPYEGITRSGTFRHPVFGNRDVWVTQSARPFLFPAIRAGRDRVIGTVEDAVADTLRRHGF